MDSTCNYAQGQLQLCERAKSTYRKLFESSHGSDRLDVQHQEIVSAFLLHERCRFVRCGITSRRENLFNLMKEETAIEDREKRDKCVRSAYMYEYKTRVLTQEHEATCCFHNTRKET